MKITIGKVDGVPIRQRSAVKIDLAVLKQTRLLITADSGGGKTYLMKKIVEEAFGKIPIHIIDPEGEFAPLREGFDFFLIAKGGDTPPVVGLARAQAQKFLEIRASVICDIYEMKPKERHEWVKEYLEGLIEAPKATRHPCLVIVDEAHLFAPEKGNSVALEPMADLASRGRKRGLILLVATQRLAKLNKDVTSEMLNRLIGPTFEDINRERAADVLGILKANKESFFEQIKMLEPGHFFALGRAISKTLIRVKIGGIKTKHGDEAEKYNTTPPPARSKIATLLKTLKELPAEEEKKAETAREFRAEIRRLREEVQTYKHEAKRIAIPAIDPKKTKAAIQTAVKARERDIRAEYFRALKRVQDAAVDLTRNGALISKDLMALSIRVDRVIGKSAKKLEIPKFKASTENDLPVETQTEAVVRKAATPLPAKLWPDKPVTVKHAPISRGSVAESTNGDAEGPINKTQTKILQVLVSLAAIDIVHPSKAMVAFWSGGSVTSSTFANNISNLKTRGMISYPSAGTIMIDRATADEISPESMTPESVKAQMEKLLSATQNEMMKAIRAVYPGEMAKTQLAEEIGAASIKSSTFNNNVSELKTAGLISYPRSGFVKMADWLDL